MDLLLLSFGINQNAFFRKNCLKTWSLVKIAFILPSLSHKLRKHKGMFPFIHSRKLQSLDYFFECIDFIRQIDYDNSIYFC